MYFCNVKKTLLYEISIIRPLVIFLLVFYHSLCVFTGGWTAPAGVPSNAFYWWLGHLVSGFRIEAIAFVGGYVFCYQCVERGRRSPLPAFIWKKFKRLIIPCFIFGALYYLLFLFHPDRFRWNVFFWRLANGVSHLWFLPMLFWCFLVCWLADRLLSLLSARSRGWALAVGWLLFVLFAVASLFRVTGLRMGFTRLNYFMFYFYLGYWLRFLLPALRRKNRPAVRPLARGWLLPVLLWLFYLVFLYLHYQVTHLRLPGFGFDCPSFLRGWSHTALHLVTLGHTACGILALYTTVMLWLRRHRTADAQPGPWLRQCSRLCYGVYVLHMFVLQYLLYYTSLPQWCCALPSGEWLLPWVLLLPAVALSALGTWLLLKTRFGRFLIG